MELRTWRDLSSPLPGPSRPLCVVHVLGSEFAPAWPLLVARQLCLDAGERLRLRVGTTDTRAALLERLSLGADLALVPASLAVRAIAQGLACRIVAASVVSGELCAVDGEPSVRFAALVGDPTPQPVVRRARAVLVASEAALRERSAHVGVALRTYWRAATLAAQQPAALTRVMAHEFDLPVEQAQAEAWRAMAAWHLEPRVSLPGLESVLRTLRDGGEVPANTRVRALVEERFYPLQAA